VTTVPATPDVDERDNLRVTANVAAPLKSVESVARTLQAPAEAEGTVKEAVNPPKTSVKIVAGVVTIGKPANSNVMVALPAKPAPATVTIVPTAPLDGASEMLGVTLKIADAVVPAISVAEMRWLPAAASGIVKTWLNQPEESVGAVRIVAASNFIVTVSDGANPAPVTVTVVPPLPVFGDREIEGVTVKVDWAEPPMLSVAFTVWDPGEAEGTVKDAANPPRPSLTMVAGVVATVAPSNVITIVLEAR